MMALGSSGTLVPSRATCHNNPEDGILHSHRHENLRSYLITSFLSNYIVIATLWKIFMYFAQDIV
jgi:hypothetical protein